MPYDANILRRAAQRLDRERREREEREEQLRLEVSFPQLGYALAVVDANSGLELACGCAGPLRRARRRQHGQRHGRCQQGG